MAVNSAVEFFGSHAVSRKVHFSPKNKHSAEEGFFKTAIFYFTQFQLDGNKRKYLQACNYYYSLKWKIIYPFKISAFAGMTASFFHYETVSYAGVEDMPMIL